MTTTLFVPGTPPTLDAWAKALGDHGLRVEDGRVQGADLDVSVEHVPNDGHFGDAFRPLPTMTDAQRGAVDAVPGALVLTLERPLQAIARPLAAMVATLGACGGLAVRVEQSKLGYPLERWVEIVGSEDPWALYRAAVLVLVDDDGALASCGMHVFALPDARVMATGREGNELLGSFNVFQLAEDPLLRSGDTFSPDTTTPRRVIERNPDTGYSPDHPCHNPFGVWHLGAPGGKARPKSDLEFVFMPSLASLLMAAEREKGASLTRAEVERLRDEAPCMSMEPKDARALERSRGYADIDPERAFEQWQSLRATR